MREATTANGAMLYLSPEDLEELGVDGDVVRFEVRDGRVVFE